MPLHRDIHWIGRQWAVTGHGMQLIDQKLKGFFDIEAGRLWEETLIETMRGKEWLNAADFEKGLEVARKRFPADGVTPPPAEVAAPAEPVASTAVPAAQPVAPVMPTASTASVVPTAPVITSIKPAKKPTPAPAQIAKSAEPPLQNSEMIAVSNFASGKLRIGFPGSAKFIRPWRVRMKE
jgi:hypothetical protein